MATSIGDLQNLVNQQSNILTAATKQQTADYNALLSRQQQQQSDLFGQYSSAVNAQPKLTDVFSQLQGQYGIPAAQQQLQGYKDQVTRVQGLLNNLVPDIASRTQGTLTTQAMRDRMAAAEGNKLSTNLNSLGTAMQPYADIVSSGNQAVSTLLPLYAQDQQKALQPLEMQINSLGDRFAREITGYTTGAQNELSALMDKLNKQFSLSEQDWQHAQQLAAQESQYNQYLQGVKLANTPAQSNGPMITAQQQNDYNFVKGLINEVQGGNGNSVSLILNQARNGDPRSKMIMDMFYQLQNKPVPQNFRSFL